MEHQDLKKRYALQLLKTSTLIIFVGFIMLACVPVTPQLFDSLQWRRGGERTRGAMVKDIIATQILIGKNEDQVSEILGRPSFRKYDFDRRETQWTYKIKNNTRCYLLWGCALLVIFDPNTAKVTWVGKTD